jgi:hypothetical protein
VEQQQVKLRIITADREYPNEETGGIVTGKDVLKQMKTNNMWRNDHHGRYAAVMFDGQTFKFREGETITVPATVGRHLRRMSGVVVGPDQLNGPVIPYLEVAEQFNMTEPQRDNEVDALRKRIAELEASQKPKTGKPASKVPWEGPQGGTLDESEE